MRPSAHLKDLERALSAWTPDAPPATTWLLPELRDLLDASFVGAYQPVATERGWRIESMHGAGATASRNVRAFQQWVAELPPSDHFVAYNPYGVEPAQRNRLVLLREIPRSAGAELIESLYASVGASGHDQARVLVCDGPRLLAWVGATRVAPFAPREAAALQYLTRPLQQRLRLERQLRPSWPRPAALEAALEALGRPAFVIGPRESIEVANRPGLALLQRDARGVLASIRQSERRTSSGGFTITRLTAKGWPAYLLAIAKDQQPTVATCVARAQNAWGLTARQTGVLELLVGGATNKEIAHLSGCAEVTVETHITGLYRRSGARSRTDLVRRVLLLSA